MLLGALPERQRQLALAYAEKTRSRVHQLLPGIASGEEYGKFVMLVLHDHDAYYYYITNYYTDVPNADELAFSSGMYINRGYGHFVSPRLSAGPFARLMHLLRVEAARSRHPYALAQVGGAEHVSWKAASPLRRMSTLSRRHVLCALPNGH